MEKILFIVPPMLSTRGIMRRITEPLAVLSIGSHLQNKGYKVDCFDMPLEGYDNLSDLEIAVGQGVMEEVCMYGAPIESVIARIHKYKPDVIGISCLYSFLIDVCKELASGIKSEFPNIPIVVGGNAPTISPQNYLINSKIDYVILGEGELRIEKLLENYSNKLPLYEGIEGIAYKDEFGKVTIIPEGHGGISDLDLVSLMKRNFINQKRYIEIGKPQAPFPLGEKISTVLVSKGCTQRCTFCNNPYLTGNKFRKRKIENIICEIQYLKNEFAVDEIQFFSESLTADKKWAKELFKALIPLNISWCAPTGLYFNSIDSEMLELMKESGCYQITLAIESASERVLKELMKKSVHLEKVKMIVDRAHELGIAVHGFFIVGMPGETREEIQSTLRFPFENNFDSISLGIVNALIGSELYDSCLKKGYISDKDVSFSVNSGDSTNIIIPTDSSEFAYSRYELEELVSETMETHYKWGQEQFPELWTRRYGKYIEKFPEEESVLTKRI